MGGLFFGGLEEIRTPDPRNANAMRSQLRYKPIFALIVHPPFQDVNKACASSQKQAEFGLTNRCAYAKIAERERNMLIIRSDTQEAEGAPLLRE